MSIGVCGIIHAKFDNSRDEIGMSFVFERIANSLNIGTKLGGNISKYVYDKYANERSRDKLLFELTDSPLDIHAEELFSPGSMLEVEPILDRMARIQELFESILEFKGIAKISLETNYLFSNDESIISVKASDLCTKMAQLYSKNEGCVPVLRLDIFR